MERFDLTTPNFTDENIQKISELFPNCVTEGDNGKAIDFDILKQELSSNLVEGNQERYQLTWPGKAKSLVTANAPINKTLRPARDESKDFDNTENLYIEGDNLEVLKLLQETYLNKIKMIYIDPPYNTGRNLIYKNDFSKSQRDFSFETEELREDGGKMVANLETNGRFHSDWLSMIFERLKLAKNLLSSDGVLICAIDENELSNLSVILKEIFNEGSYSHSYVSIVHNPRGQQGVNFSYVNEYLLFVYPSDGKKYLSDFIREKVDSRNLRDSGTESNREDARTCFYPFIVRDGVLIGAGEVPSGDFHPASSNITLSDGSLEIWPINESGVEKKWRYSNASVHKIFDKLEAKEGRNSLQIIFNKDTGTIKSVWADARYDSSEYGTKLVNSLIKGSGFTYPKSLWAVYDCVLAATQDFPDAIIFDFFSGSGTTAHAVMQLNAKDGGNRKFIMAQIPEATDEKSEACKSGYKTIAEIGKERIRRAGEKIKEDNTDKEGIDDLDIGFRVLKVDSSNMKNVYFSPDNTSQDDMFDLASNIKDDRTDEDLLFMVLLDWGIDLSVKIERREVLGKTVYFADDNFLAACFEEKLDEDFVKAVVAEQPRKVVLRDSGFASSSVKINVEQIFKQADIEVKVI